MSESQESPASPEAVHSDRQPLIHPTLDIEVTGHDYRWHARYPDLAGESSSAESFAVRDLHVPVGTNVILRLKSTDYVYIFALPDYGLKEIAVPRLEFRLEFCATEPGQFELYGDELCGDPHPLLQGHFVVESQDRYLAWRMAQQHQPADVVPPQ